MTRIALLAVVACSTPPGKPQPYTERIGVVTNTRPAAVPDEVVVTVAALRNDTGTVRCFLYDSPDGFPESEAHIVGRAVSLPKARTGNCRFVGVARDHDYAIVVMHDENNDGLLQKNLLGIPTEGYGFSNDVRARFSAPSYEDCRFHFTSHTDALTITAQY